ncbi:MAG: tetratricopeptide repeat protein, partial [Rhodoferax sp.]|uniref:tetratricopeptide repeat protein n=1 Tax=Rhodoferax sp. TaxID=50421 RepID=UPI003263F70D
QRTLDNPLNQLTPYSRSTPLLGRDDELAQLQAFLDAPQPIRVRVLTGSGGSGKTRLALDLCDRLAQEGWDTGFVTGDEAQRFIAQQNLSTWGWQKPTLVVMDYAAAKAQMLHTWLSELANRSTPAPHPLPPLPPLRLLLLERHADVAGGWWQTAFGGDARQYAKQALLDPPAPMPIRPLFAASDRLALLQHMLQQVNPDQPMALTLNDPAFHTQLMAAPWAGDPLFLMMAALYMVKVDHAKVLALGRTDLAQAVAGWEIARLSTLAQAHKLPPKWVLHLAACATLAQGIGRAQLLAFAKQDKTAMDWVGSMRDVVELLLQALPQPGGIAPVVPDVVGEAMLLKVLENEQDAVLRCYAALGHRVAETVVRCAQDFAEVSAQPLKWLNAMVDGVQKDAAGLNLLISSIPFQSMALRDVYLRVAQCRLALCLDDPAQHAAALNDLAIAHAQLGQPEKASQTAQQALDLYRTLAAQRPDVYTPDLATSLNTLANIQSAIGDHEAALQTAQQAVNLYRTLATQRPDVYTPDLAMSLNNLASMQSAMGDHAAALQTAQQAVDLRRTLAAQRPDVYTPDLASSLNNLANMQSDVGDHEAALQTAQHAVDLRRTLAAQRPDVYTPDLATSLNNLAIRQSAMGDHEEALQTAQHAVDLYRTLAAQRPDVYTPDLAMSLNNLANRQSDMGNREAALQTAQQAVDLRRTLAKQRPDVYTPNLATSLIVLALCTHAIQGAPTAWHYAHEAVATLQKPFLQRPQVHRRLMEAILTQYFKLCQAAGQEPDAALLAPLIPYFPQFKE